MEGISFQSWFQVYFDFTMGISEGQAEGSGNNGWEPMTTAGFKVSTTTVRIASFGFALLPDVFSTHECAAWGAAIQAGCRGLPDGYDWRHYFSSH